MIGSTLSHYLIEAELGRGGMGIVYKARDTKLDREVAIKVLPSAALASADDRERFYREAKSAAALNHPNIAQVYQIDEAVPSDAPHGTEPSPFIAMEYIAGGTLQDKIKEAPLKLSDAVKIASQVAEALKAAHAKNIVHRDIKSANVMITEDGVAKVLDFGLAKTNQSTMLTRMGSTLGTVAYMSPEQARGQEVDGRTDLYSLGTMLYEMVAGRLPFAGEYEQAVVYSILNEPPEPLTSLRTGVPMQLEWIVNKLLAKDADYRYQTAADLLADLKALDLSGSGMSRRSMPAVSAAATTAIPSATGPSAASLPTKWLGISVGTALLGFMLAWIVLNAMKPERAVPPVSLVEMTFPDIVDIRFPRLSPSGDYLAFSGFDTQGNQGLFLRNMSTGQIRFIEETSMAGGWEFDFSPDGSEIAFSSGLNGGVFTVDVPNGLPERRSEFGRFGFWESQTEILFSDDKPGGGELYRLDLTTDEIEPLQYDGPELPEGYGNVLKTFDREKRVAYGHQLFRANLGDFKLFSLELDTGEYRVLESNAANPEFVAGGLLTYQIGGDDGRLVVRPVNRDTGEFVGRPEDALPGPMSYGWGRYAVTPAGDLLTIPGISRVGLEMKLWQVQLDDQQIQEVPFSLPENRLPRGLNVGDNASFLVFYTILGTDQGAQLFGIDLQERIQYQYTYDRLNFDPVLVPEKGTIIYGSAGLEVDTVNVRTAAFAGSSIGAPTDLPISGSPVSISPDGRFLLVGDNSGNQQTMTLMNLESMEAVWSETADRYGPAASFSGDSKYVAFHSRGANESREIIVRSTGSRERQILPDISAANPVFAGEDLYFRNEESILKMPVRTSPAFAILGQPEVAVSVAGLRDFDITRDGSTLFAVAREISFQTANSQELASKVVWRQHWGSNQAGALKKDQ